MALNGFKRLASMTDTISQIYRGEYVSAREGGIIYPRGKLENPVLKSIKNHHDYNDLILGRGDIIRYRYSRYTTKNAGMQKYLNTLVRFHYVDEHRNDFDGGWYLVTPGVEGEYWKLVRFTPPLATVDRLPIKDD